MKNYAAPPVGDVPRTSGVFPRIATIADTAPGSKDGTPLHKVWGDDVFSLLQTILNAASMTPSGTAETCGAAAGDVAGSQLFEALQLCFGTPGDVFAHALATPTSTLPTGMRAEKCDGSLVRFKNGATNLKYHRLMTYKYIGDGNNADTDYKCFYKCDAGGSRTTAGEYFKLPDFRGAFLRGADSAATHDPDGATRKCGDIQAASLDEHVHTAIEVYSGLPPFADVNVNAYNTPGAGGGALYATLAAGDPLITSSDGSGIGDETRPTNAMICWCIRY